MDKRTVKHGWCFIASMCLICLIFLSILWKCGFEGNYWFTEASVLRALQAKNSNVEFIMYIERHIFERSMIRVNMWKRDSEDFWLESNILFRYKFFDKSLEEEREAITKKK